MVARRESRPQVLVGPQRHQRIVRRDAEQRRSRHAHHTRPGQEAERDANDDLLRALPAYHADDITPEASRAIRIPSSRTRRLTEKAITT